MSPPAIWPMSVSSSEASAGCFPARALPSPFSLRNISVPTRPCPQPTEQDRSKCKPVRSTDIPSDLERLNPGAAPGSAARAIEPIIAFRGFTVGETVAAAVLTRPYALLMTARYTQDELLALL